ncbi:MAG: PAS domain S-box protein [Opitutaceae bacterium]
MVAARSGQGYHPSCSTRTPHPETTSILERTAFREVAENLPDTVVLTDAEGRITWTNQAFHDLCGHSRSAVRNRKPGSFLQGPETDPETVARVRSAIRERRPVNAELLNYHQDGRPYWVSLRITPLRNQTGEVDGFIAIEREVTRAHNREHSLEHQVAELYTALIGLVDPTQAPQSV